MITEKQADFLLRDMQDDRPLYLFMDEQENVVRSEWLLNDELAKRFAEVLRKRSGGPINVLRYIGTAE